MENKKGSITTAQNKLLHAVLHDMEWTHEDFSTSLGFSVSDLSMSEASMLIDGMRNKLAGKDVDINALISAVQKMHASADEKKENTPDTSNTSDPIADAARMIAEAEERDRKRRDLMSRNANKQEAKHPEPAKQEVVPAPFTVPQEGMANLASLPQMLNHIFRSIMQSGTDYGVVPGTEKPTLLKPGAELLRRAFGYTYTEEESGVEDLEKGIFFYKVKVHFFRDGVEIGTGIGSCNNMETRYASRWVFDSDVPAGMEIAGLKYRDRDSRKTGKSYRQYLIEPSLNEKATQANTILKMAKKRAFVDGILSLTGASRIFTQDVEDLQ